MNVVTLKQGSAEWIAYRKEFFNASDAPAMMGVSPYKTRTELLDEMKSGLSAEVSDQTQRIFDAGHRFEALARPLAEALLGEELYPVVANFAKYSASFDGITMDERIAFEHKSLNDELREAFADMETINPKLRSEAGFCLPKAYQVQMEQQLLVSGAEKVLFIASTWEGESCVEEHHCFYLPDLTLREEILKGWAQFEKDLESHVIAVKTVKAIGHTPETLPALFVEVTGEVTASNLDQYKEHALAVFSGINRELKSDQDFADAEKTVKWCADVESRLVAVKEHALSQTQSIDELFKAIDDISAEAKRTRLELDKLVKARKEELRTEIVMDATNKIQVHMNNLDERIGKLYMPPINPDFAGAIKGKKSLDSMRSAVADVVTQAILKSNDVADQIMANMKFAEQWPDMAHLWPDMATLVLKAGDDFTAAIQMRIEAFNKAQAEKAAQVEQVAAIEAAKAIATVATLPPMTKILETTSNAYDMGPMLNLGEINARLGVVSVSSDGLAKLGFQSTSAKQAKLYREADMPLIVAAIVKHLNDSLAKADMRLAA